MINCTSKRDKLLNQFDQEIKGHIKRKGLINIEIHGKVREGKSQIGLECFELMKQEIKKRKT